MEVTVNNSNKIFEQWVVRNNYRNSVYFSAFILVRIKEFKCGDFHIY